MLFAHANYPVMPLPPIAAIFLEGFLANEACRATDFEIKDGPAPLDDLAYQRACAFYSGARERALTTGHMASHAEQAATLLVMIDEVKTLIDGGYSIGCELKLDEDEMGALRLVRDGAIALLRWHFENGAGALRPIADDLGLLHGKAA